jgi:hypothetical protein
LAIVAVASATVEVRIWLTTEDPATHGVTFVDGYGPFTPFTTGYSDWGDPYAIHQNFVPGDPDLQIPEIPGSTDLPKFRAYDFTQPAGSRTQIPDVVAPTGLLPGTPVYIWAAFCGTVAGNPAPPKPLLGWESNGAKVQGMHLVLDHPASLHLDPLWYQSQSPTFDDFGNVVIAQRRWEEPSDMTGDVVILVGIESEGWVAGAALDNLQSFGKRTATATNGEGAILLGAIAASGFGDLKIGLGFNGMASTDETGMIYFPGTETTGIPAGVSPDLLRVGQTPEATWVPEPAALWMLGLSLVAVRRRRPRA